MKLPTLGQLVKNDQAVPGPKTDEGWYMALAEMAHHHGFEGDMTLRQMLDFLARVIVDDQLGAYTLDND